MVLQGEPRLCKETIRSVETEGSSYIAVSAEGPSMTFCRTVCSKQGECQASLGRLVGFSFVQAKNAKPRLSTKLPRKTPAGSGSRLVILQTQLPFTASFGYALSPLLTPLFIVVLGEQISPSGSLSDCTVYAVPALLVPLRSPLTTRIRPPTCCMRFPYCPSFHIAARCR